MIAAILAIGAFVVLRPGSDRAAVSGKVPPVSVEHQPASAGRKSNSLPRPLPLVERRAPFPVGVRILELVDRSRQIHLHDGTAIPRRLTTEIRYPARGAASGTVVRDATPAADAGPYPLIVFGHGFSVTPGVYSRLLQAWARAGYVVAAPIFPLENAHAPGGPNESDLINQPRDVRFVISALLARSAAHGGPIHNLLDPTEVAVAGQSDGGETALAVTYDKYFRDSRVRAAAILSGAKIPGEGGLTFPPGSPPLLATQGTADKVNPPTLTRAFFALARRPKYRLDLFGASHLLPYSSQQPQLGIVERVTTAFFDLYLKETPGAKRRLLAQGDVTGTASLDAQP